MKKLFIYPALVILLGACNNNQAEKQEEIDSAQNAAIDTLSNLQERARIEDSLESVSAATVSEAPAGKEGTGTAEKPARKTGNTRSSNTGGTPSKTGGDDNTAGTATTSPAPSTGTTSGNETAETGTTKEDDKSAPEEKKKKGINNTVKGAIIGAGAGAVGGAIINKKNPGKGAIIGGVVGAGAGAVTGVILDKNKKKKEAKDTASTKTTTKEPDSKKTGGDEKP